MRNKFLLGIVSVALASCFGGASTVDLLKSANNKWESFKAVSAEVLATNDKATDEIKAVKSAIVDLENTEYTDANLAVESNKFVKAFAAAKDDINAIEDGLYSKMNTAWGEYEKAADAYIASLPGRN